MMRRLMPQPAACPLCGSWGYLGPNGSTVVAKVLALSLDGPANPSVSERRTYNVIAERAGDIWFISVPSVPEALASTRRRYQIEAIVRVVIAQALHVPRDSFEVEISSPDG